MLRWSWNLIPRFAEQFLLFLIVAVRCFFFIMCLSVFWMGRCGLFRFFVYRSVVLILHARVSSPCYFW